MLYAGYVGFAVAFAFAVAAMLAGRIDQAWPALFVNQVIPAPQVSVKQRWRLGGSGQQVPKAGLRPIQQFCQFIAITVLLGEVYLKAQPAFEEKIWPGFSVRIISALP